MNRTKRDNLERRLLLGVIGAVTLWMLYVAFRSVIA